MANANKPRGLVPVGHLLGLDWSGKARLYSIDANYATALAIGDPVITGGGADANGVPNIILAAATGAIRGVIVGLGTKEGLMANPSNLDITYKPASQTTVWSAMVIDDPYVIFETQEVATGTPLTAAAIGLNTNLVLGANNGYVSGWTLDNATEDVTATLQCRILGLARRSDNAFGLYAKYLVTINNHELKAGTVGL